jgi:starch-binding outer membrane protein, SusD/RagB family
MKNIIYSILIVLTLLQFSSCEDVKFGDNFVEQAPENLGITLDTVFSNKFNAMQVLTRAYTTLPYAIPTGNNIKLGGDLLDALSDLSYSTVTYGGAQRLYYPGSYSAGTEGANSKLIFTDGNTWTGIRFAWIFIENVNRVPDMSSTEKDRATAEAKMIIATHYAEMIRHFGGLPWIDHAISVNEEFVFPRQTFEKTVDNIVKLIDEAAPNLEWRVADENDNGRMTKAYALGLKLRVLLFAASPLFNNDQPFLAGAASTEKLTWYGNYDANRWKAAEAAGKEFMDALNSGGSYALVNASGTNEAAYREAFRKAYFERDNGEVLLSTRLNFKNNFAGRFCGGSDNFASGQAPTLKFANLFPLADGTDFPTDFDWANAPVDPFSNRDPRFYETVLTNGRAYKGRLSELFVGGQDRKLAGSDGTGLLLYKFSQDYTSATSLGAVDSWPYLRLTEVFLSYAEAINEANGAPNSVAYDMVNRIRNRVGLPDLPSGLSQQQFREAVLRERACELGYEEVRWFDIIRWKIESAFLSPVQGVNMFIDATKPTGYRYEIFELRDRAWKSNWSPKWYLSAFPTDEVDKKYGLIQNPGW